MYDFIVRKHNRYAYVYKIFPDNTPIIEGPIMKVNFIYKMNITFVICSWYLNIHTVQMTITNLEIFCHLLSIMLCKIGIPFSGQFYTLRPLKCLNIYQMFLKFEFIYIIPNKCDWLPAYFRKFCISCHALKTLYNNIRRAS